MFFDVKKKEMNLKSIIEDIMLTKEKVAELDETGQKLKEFKQVVEDIQQLNKEMDDKILAKAKELDEKEKFIQGKLA